MSDNIHQPMTDTEKAAEKSLRLALSNATFAVGVRRLTVGESITGGEHGRNEHS